MSPPLAAPSRVEPCLQVLPDFEKTVGIRAETADTLVVTLNNRTPFFSDLVAFYPLYPVNPDCVQKHGSPAWTRPENIVTNGAFKLEFRRIRDRLRLVKNERYWDAASVKLNVIDALAVKGETTSLNMYLNGQIDWSTQIPLNIIPKLKADFTDQFRYGPELTTYFYRINVTRPELSDKRVRRALAMAIDKRAICENVTKAGELPATALCPPGMADYTPPAGAAFDPDAAKRLLAEAGYPGGRGLPTIEILYNDLEAHRKIAEIIQQMWRTHLDIGAELRSLEWGVYLDTTHKIDYDVARAGWVADYADPNTFLDMFVTGGENNQTGWSNARYDELIGLAASETDPAKRMQHFTEAETILLDEQPIIPIYFRVSKNLVQPRVQGFFNNVQDEHPLKLLSVEP
jgi:oligopeptide transport system substrate-binding protein